ncbi:beta-galactosidase [Halalkalibacter urbisdiaboli]|uniref:beta-galactosidase n=1 Tax=Halalkalibacter urbisdiaboli TaxID=1960589 RepID=UPI000B4431DD|nr:beta-galactosidase [Halalkalibacter urbisdiaboli]
MLSERMGKMVYGGDYNPEQWERAVWDEDMRLFKKANIDFVRVNIFSWALSQPDEVTYQFEWLDEVLDFLYEHGIKVGLGTSTAAHPAWMARKYPDILRTEFNGQKRKFGGRHNSCPNSPSYRQFSTRLVKKLVERYKHHPAIMLWNISNEFGGACYCKNCEKAFRVWLKERYGTLEALNQAWNTRFWGHTFYEWDEIVSPSLLSEHFAENRTMFQGISLDYARFNSDSMLACYLLEYHEIKREIPDAIVTTNIMGAYKPLDYFKWAKHMDVIGWDNYPSIDTPISYSAMMHDLMRGLKQGQPFLLMEQTPSQTNWQPYNSLKRPGVLRLWSYQAVAHGADSVLYFQMRRSIGACEKFHGAVIEHAGHEQTRVFKEVANLGEELVDLTDTLLQSTIRAKAAIVFDWENWWALEYSSGPNESLRYLDQIHKYYAALYKQNIQVDMIGVEASLDSYDIVIAPVLYMVKPGYAKRIETFVANGGTFLTTFLSGIVDENDRVTLGGYPGELRTLLGIWSEEIDSLSPEHTNQIVMKQRFGSLEGTYSCQLLFDLIHTEGAEVIAEYGEDFYKGRPAVTAHSFAKGEAWYVATDPEQSFVDELMREICLKRDVRPLVEPKKGIEVSKREKDGKEFLFILNHNAEEEFVNVGDHSFKNLFTNEVISKQLTLEGKGVALLERL